MSPDISHALLLDQKDQMVSSEIDQSSKRDEGTRSAPVVDGKSSGTRLVIKRSPGRPPKRKPNSPGRPRKYPLYEGGSLSHGPPGPSHSSRSSLSLHSSHSSRPSLSLSQSRGPGLIHLDHESLLHLDQENPCRQAKVARWACTILFHLSLLFHLLL